MLESRRALLYQRLLERLHSSSAICQKQYVIMISGITTNAYAGKLLLADGHSFLDFYKVEKIGDMGGM